MQTVPPGMLNCVAVHCTQLMAAALDCDQIPVALAREIVTGEPTKPALELQVYVKLVTDPAAVAGLGVRIALGTSGRGGRERATTSAALSERL
jgi:hypothetical protein